MKVGFKNIGELLEYVSKSIHLRQGANAKGLTSVAGFSIATGTRLVDVTASRLIKVFVDFPCDVAPLLGEVLEGAITAVYFPIWL